MEKRSTPTNLLQLLENKMLCHYFCRDHLYLAHGEVVLLVSNARCLVDVEEFYILLIYTSRSSRLRISGPWYAL